MRPIFSRPRVSVTMLATLTVSMSSHASINSFDNPAGPAYFDWSPSAGNSSYLDLFLPASNQLNVSTPSSLRQANQGDISQVGFGNFQVATGGFQNLFAIGVTEGTLINDSFTWEQFGYIFVDGLSAEIAEGQPTYLAVRFDLGAGFQYGWVGVVRSGLELGAFAWGYETEVGVPIAAGATPPQPCASDIDDSGAVDVNDLLAVILGWGPCPAKGQCLADTDGSGVVDTDDLLAVIVGWGPCR